VSIGNDVVDLLDPETRLGGLHPRFAERVFTARERAALEASPSPRLMHWALWAAKESAYKALKRLVPEAVFAPKAFEVEPPPWPVPSAAGVATGRVFYHGRRFELALHRHGAIVHAIATSDVAADAAVLWRVKRAEGDPGLAVRGLAAGAIGFALGLDPAGLRIVGRPPVATYRGRRLAVDVSLSHHGRFVAFACAQPRIGSRSEARSEEHQRPSPQVEPVA
jgi:hypothetical protein